MFTGGCHCGAIRYLLSAMPFDSDYCHCSDCRRTIGAPCGVWRDYKVEQIEWTRGEPKEYRSSEKIRRGFCSHCGTSLTYRHLEYADYLTVNVSSLDNPNLVVPRYHIYTSQKVEWHRVDDSLPKYADSRSNA
jgi:hypothetical protein